jgi:signal transduction histidine kinase
MAKNIVGRMRDHIKRVPPRREPFDLNEAIREVIATFRSAMNQKGVSVSARLIEGLTPIQGDRVQLQQVVMNLVLNAVEAMDAVEKGTRKLSISTEQSESGGALVSIRDSGPGIDREKIEQIFEPFYTTKGSGIGMGLSICWSIVAAHGGRLRAEANRSVGAVFHFTLPSDTDS